MKKQKPITIADSVPAEFDIIHLEQTQHIIGNAVVCGDLHSLAMDWLFSEKIAPVAEKLMVDTLIIAGDIHNADAWSKYPHIEKPPTWKQEKEAFRRRMVDWLEAFANIYILMGNHDRRKQKANFGEEDDKDLFAYLFTPPPEAESEADLARAFYKSRKIHTSNLDHLILHSNNIPWYVAHGTEYGKPGFVGNRLVQKHQMNVITHHQHHFGELRDDFDRYTIVDNGAMCDPGKLAYMTMDTNGRPISKRGFTVIRNGSPLLFHRDPSFTDWDYWLN